MWQWSMPFFEALALTLNLIPRKRARTPNRILLKTHKKEKGTNKHSRAHKTNFLERFVFVLFSPRLWSKSRSAWCGWTKVSRAAPFDCLIIMQSVDVCSPQETEILSFAACHHGAQHFFYSPRKHWKNSLRLNVKTWRFSDSQTWFKADSGSDLICFDSFRSARFLRASD